MVDNDSARVTYHVRWPATRPSQHGALWGTLQVASSISPSPGDIVMQVVPTECLVHRGGGAAPDEQYSKLVRRVHAADDLCDFKAAVWTWWREQPLPRQTLPAHCLIRKALKSTQGGNVHVPFAAMRQGNFLDMQTYLGDRTRPYFVLLSDLAKAFERVNSDWVLRILQILNAPVWVLQLSL